MGIVERTLEEFELSNFETCYIEHNANGTIHLHMDGLRVEFSPQEFTHFVAVVSEARETLVELKEFDSSRTQVTPAVVEVFDATD